MTGHAAPDPCRTGCAILAAARELAASPDFEVSDRLRDLLVFLAERSNANESRKISQTEIALNVMGLDRTFNPAIDAHVRIAVSRLRKAMRLYYAEKNGVLDGQLEIPKGEYKVVSRASSRPAGAFSQAAQQDRQSIPMVVIGYVCDTSATHRETLDLILTEASTIAQNSPLIQASVLGIAMNRGASLDENLEAARRAQCQALVVIQTFTGTKSDLVYFLVLDSRDARVLWSDRVSIARGSLRKASSLIARRLAEIATDPLSGVVPGFVAARHPASPISPIMRSYAFMTLQRPHLAASALNALEEAGKSDTAPALVVALHADMVRACRGMNVLDSDVSQARCLDLAEEAAARDIGNVGIQLAVGYARLAMGDLEGARQITSHTRKQPLFGGVSCDSRTLIALTEPIGTDCETDLAGDDCAHVLDEISQLITLIRTRKFEDAAEMTERTGHFDATWHQILGASVFSHLGDRDKAIRYARSASVCAPQAAKKIRATLRGFFAEDDLLETLTDGFKRASAPVA